MKYSELINFGEEKLKNAGVIDSRLDSWYMIEDITGMSRQQYYMNMDEDVDERVFERYMHLLDRRCAREPLQYILGHQQFMGYDFIVNEHVLIPRYDTENLVEEVNRIVREKAAGSDERIGILDMCTGSGCIIVSLIGMNDNVRGYAVDLSQEALDVAARNIDRYNLNDRIALYQGDLFQAIRDRDVKVDIIVSNPPYIPTDEIAGLMPEVAGYEPHMALDGAEDGLYFYREIAESAPGYLREEGYVAVEIGYDQGDDVRDIFAAAGFADIRVIKDYQSNDRIVVGHL